MPGLGWSLLFVVTLILLFKIRRIVRIRRVLGLLSYTKFLTSCEIGTMYSRQYRRSTISFNDAYFLARLLPRLEARKVLVGRDARGRCLCDREYCLMFNSRRRRRFRFADLKHYIPAGKPA